MPVVKRIRNRGATITVEANAEVLFMPNGDVHNWTNRFTGRIRAGTIAAAPRNKRPRWSHYGKALHTTIVSARPRFWGNGRDKQRVYGAVGSTAPHAPYVDQGTGTFAGRSPWKAKVLPPTTQGGGNLYEHTWRPGGPGGKRVKPVYIKGQRAQNFFDKGLRAAFQSMRLRSAQVAGEAKIGNVLNSMPTMMENFPGGNTPANAAFIAQLEEWRQWRTEAYNRDEWLRPGERRQRDIDRDNRVKKPKKSTPPKPPKPAVNKMERALEAAKREMANYRMRHPQARFAGYDSEGFWTIGPDGQRVRHYWSIRVADLFAEAGAQHTTG